MSIDTSDVSDVIIHAAMFTVSLSASSYIGKKIGVDNGFSVTPGNVLKMYLSTLLSFGVVGFIDKKARGREISKKEILKDLKNAEKSL